MNYEPAVAIGTAIIGLAIVAVVFSRKSQTSAVISAAGDAFAGLLTVAVSPITGGGPVANQGAPGSFGPFTPSTVSSLFNTAGGIGGALPIPGIGN